MRWLYVTVLCAVLAIVLAATAGAMWHRPVDRNAVTVLVLTTHGHGSGVVIGDGHYILTAKHVTQDGVAVVQTADGVRHAVSLLWESADGDFALLKVFDKLPAAELRCDDPVVGDRLEVVGAPVPGPDPLFWYHSWGEVGGFYYIDPGYGWMMLFSASIYSGNSGGPAFDEDGRVIGIVVAMAAALAADWRPAPLGFDLAVPASRICEAMAW